MPQNRYSPMPQGQYADMNPEMADAISDSPVFASIANEVAHEREMQAMRYTFIYGLADTITGRATIISPPNTLPFILTIDQGSDFKCVAITASAFNYDAAVATDFPIVNSLGSTAWAGRGLSMRITDTNAGRDLTSGSIPFELLGTPGYGLNFQNPYPFRYYFRRNNKIRFDVTNRDGTTAPGRAATEFAIALLGFKIVTPE